jgi:hypothetical protein
MPVQHCAVLSTTQPLSCGATPAVSWSIAPAYVGLPTGSGPADQTEPTRVSFARAGTGRKALAHASSAMSRMPRTLKRDVWSRMRATGR